MPITIKSEQIERRLRHSISRGIYKPGTMLPTEKDLVGRYSVSRTTVREALKSLANEGIVERRQGAGTYVAENAKKGLIALLANLDQYNSSVSHYTRTMIEELRSCVTDMGYQASFEVGHGTTPAEFADSIHLLERPVAKKTLGVISLWEMGNMDKLFQKAGIPSVVIVTAASRCKYNVLLDYEKIAELGCRELRRAGVNDFAIMYARSFPGQEREPWFVEYQRIIRSMGVGSDNLLEIPASWESFEAYERFKDWWARPNRPRAMFFFDDSICAVASSAMLELGIKIPEELKVITMANRGRKFNFPKPITSVGFDLAQVARVAWDYLDDIMNGRDIPNHVMVEPMLFEGQTL